MTDPDGNTRCPSVVVDGGEVPQKYYRSSSKPSGGCITAFQEDVGHGTLSAFVVVDRQSSLDVPVKVDKEGSQLTWEFFGEDVIFGVFYQEEGAGEQVNDNVTEVVKPSRIKGLGKVAETGIVTCSKTGTCEHCARACTFACVHVLVAAFICSRSWVRRWQDVHLAEDGPEHYVPPPRNKREVSGSVSAGEL
ncbi:SEC14-like protein 2, partial [Ixodes scapularis]